MTEKNKGEIAAYFESDNSDNKEVKDQQPRRRKLKPGVIIALVLILILGFILVKGRHKETVEEVKPVAKKVETITIGDAATSYALLNKTLKITSENEAQIYAEYTGRITEVNFKIGDTVEAGQVLAKFDQSAGENSTILDVADAGSALNYAQQNLVDTKEAAEKEVKISKNNVEMAKVELEKAEDGEEGAKDKKTAQEVLEQAERQRDLTRINAEQQINAARRTLENAQINYQKAVLAYEKTIIKAPVSGTIVQKSVDKNGYVQAGTLLASISNNNSLMADTFLTAEEIRGLKVGDNVAITCSYSEEEDKESMIKALSSTSITADGKGGFENQAQISAISELPNAANMRYGLTLSFPENDLTGNQLDSLENCIMVNQFVQAQFLVPANSTENKYFLPLEAIKIGQTRSTVFVIEDNVAHVREVETGRVFGEYVEVVAGLNQGEKIAVTGSRNLQDGNEVAVVEDALEN